MGWQEELRRLDAELADGQITHDQHRRLRDELLASASGGAMASPRASPLQRGEQAAATAWRSTNPGSEPRPAATPTTDPAPTPTEPPARRRSPASALLENGRPTTAPSPADHRRTESVPYPLLDQPTQRLRPVPAVPPLMPSGRRVPPRTPPARTPGNPRGQKPTWLFISLGVLLVLALIIGGAWWLGRAEDNAGGPSGQPEADQLPGTSAEVALADRLPALPGEPSPENSTLSIDKGAELDLYPAQVADAFREHGATEVIHRGSADGETAYFLLVVPTPEPANAQALVDTMRTLAKSSGYRQIEADQPAVSTESGGRRRNMSWYASGATAVNIWVSQPRTGNQSALVSELDRTINSLGSVLPSQ